MSDSLTSVLFQPNITESRRFREIENDFLLRSVADSSSKLVEFQKVSLCVQVGLAQRMGQLECLSKAVGRDITEGLATISSQLSGIGSGIEYLSDIALDQLDAIYDLQETLTDGFKQVARLLTEQHRFLSESPNS